MSLNRITAWLLVCGWSLLVLPAANAQEGVPAFAPGMFEENDFQLFSQPELSDYGGALNRAPHGWWGSSEFLFWSVSAPPRAQIGVEDGQRQVYVNNATPGLIGSNTPAAFLNQGIQFTTQTNSVDTGFISAAMHSGMRFEGGYMDDDDKGWFGSVFSLNGRTQTLTASNASMVFTEPNVPVYDGLPGGPQSLPILYGFIDATGGGTSGLTPDGFDDDLNRNNLYGRDGRDRGLVANNTLVAGTTLSGQPSREGQTDTLTVPFGAGGPPPGTPAAGAAKQPIDYGDAVPLPIIFTQMTVFEKSWAWGGEFNRTWRIGTDHFGGTWEAFVGPRFFDYSSELGVTGIGGILANSAFDAVSNNRVVAGQLGVRYRKQFSRIGIDLQGRIAGGGNFQTTRLQGYIGSELTELLPNPVPAFVTVPVPSTLVTPAPTVTTQLVVQTNQPNNPGGGPTGNRVNQPLNLNPSGFNTSQHNVTFAPIGELRANFTYQAFNQVWFNFGWTGIFASGMQVASKKIDYTLPSLGIHAGGDQHNVLLNGVNIGVQFNH